MQMYTRFGEIFDDLKGSATGSCANAPGCQPEAGPSEARSHLRNFKA